jgi:hypothetical protein
MGATEKRWSKPFISLIFYALSKPYKGLDRLAQASHGEVRDPVPSPRESTIARRKFSSIAGPSTSQPHQHQISDPHD